MSWSGLHVRNHKRETDCAIHSAYSRFAATPAILEAFHELVSCARKKAPRLFEAPIVQGRHRGVDALANLARFRYAHIRTAKDWTGTSSSWRPAISSMAHHLVGNYDVPRFLASSWHTTDATGDNKRRWFIAHSQGTSIRSLDLPISLTRKMEHIFLGSPDHLPIEHALRRAELLALGATPEIIEAVLSTRLATDFRNGDFWRTFWLFLIANADDIDDTQIGPLIDYLQEVRHNLITVETLTGTTTLNPPNPTFSMKGRTVASMVRLMQEWHKNLGSGSGGYTWKPSPFAPMLLEEPPRNESEKPRRWQMTELTNSAQLRIEGAALHHCVATYSYRCYSGASRIWSLRLWKGDKVRHVLTVEVDLSKRAIIQARGFANRTASGTSRRLMQAWANRERLQVSV